MEILYIRNLGILKDLMKKYGDAKVIDVIKHERMEVGKDVKYSVLQLG